MADGRGLASHNPSELIGQADFRLVQREAEIGNPQRHNAASVCTAEWPTEPAGSSAHRGQLSLCRPTRRSGFSEAVSGPGPLTGCRWPLADRRAGRPLHLGQRSLTADRAIHRLHDLEDGDFRGRSSQPVAAIRPFNRVQDSCRDQGLEHLEQEARGMPVPGRCGAKPQACSLSGQPYTRRHGGRNYWHVLASYTLAALLTAEGLRSSNREKDTSYP